MLIVRPIGPGAGRYYAGSPEPGRWEGGGAAALGLTGEVDLGALADVLGGRHQEIPLGDPRHPRRRAGWDLTFAAPKGVSLVAGVLGGPAGDALVTAHRSAVDEALAFARRHALWAWAGPDRYVHAGQGMVAARFEHDRSAAGDPHLHTHVLLVNALQSPDTRWSAVASSPLWRSEREMGVIYQLGLRHHVALAGYRPDWEGPDLAGIPRPAIVAGSRRQAEMTTHRANERPSARGPAARAVTRSATSTADPAGWRLAVEKAGLDPARAAALLRRGAPGPQGPDPGRAREALAAQASSFTIRDVIRTLGSICPAGMSAAAAEAWAEQFCAGAVPAGPGRWTSPEAQAADRAVVDHVQGRQADGVGVVAHRRVAAAVADPALDGDGAEAVRRLLADGRGVDIVAGDPGRDRLGAQAAVLDVARTAWQASGYQIGMAGEGRRWEALTAIGDRRRLAGPAQILVVDRADRLAPPELAAVLADAGRAKVVLVEGGTLPQRHRPLSAGLVAAGDAFGRADPGRVAPLPALSGAPVQAAEGVAVVASGRDAVAHLVGVWEQSSPSRPTLMVGAGPAEVALLNEAARSVLVERGAIGGAAMVSGGRTWQAGDRVLALRANQALGVPAASLGTVAGIDAGGRAMTVAWDGQRGARRIERGRAGFVGYGYATTPALAASAGVDAAVLGAPERSGPGDNGSPAWPWSPPPAIRCRPPERHPTLDAAVVDAGVAGVVTGVRGGRSVADLADEHRRLGARLAAGLPPDPAGPRQRLAEEIRWRQATGGPGHADLERRAGEVERLVTQRREWLSDHAGALGRWDALGQAIEAREDLLAHALAASPGDERHRALGPAPEDPTRRAGWARALRHAAVSAERRPAGPAIADADRARPASEAISRAPRHQEAGLGLGLG